MEKIVIAMAGFGAIGKVHQLALSDIPYIYPGSLPSIDLKGVCASSPERSIQAAEQGGFRTVYKDYDAILSDAEVDLIIIVSPNFMHKDQIIKAMKAGKHILCEKPLALDGSEIEEIRKAAPSSTSRVGMVFNYRFVPAIMKAKEMVDAGRIGHVYSFRGEYFHTGYQDPRRPYSWRMDFDRSGGGALADMGIHVIDLIRYLLGDFSKVRAEFSTFIEERPYPDGSGRMGKVTVDDAAWVQCELQGGGKGSIEISRFATGTLDDLNLSIYGSKGSLRFKLMDPNFLEFFEAEPGDMGWNRIDTVQKYPGAQIPSPRSSVGWIRFHTENQYQFLRALVQGREFVPSIEDGAAAQIILDGAYRSAKTDQPEIILPLS